MKALLALELDARWPEAEEVRLDATARLAKLLQKQGKVSGALKLVNTTLAAKLRRSFYLANLHSVRGELMQSQVAQLDKAGKKEDAKKAARDALAAFEESIRINKALQQTFGKKPVGGSNHAPKKERP